MDLLGLSKENESKLCSHLIEISKIVQNKKLQKLEHENEKLRERNESLEREILSLKNELSNRTNNNTKTNLTQDTIISENGNDDDSDMTDISPIKSQQEPDILIKSEASTKRILFSTNSENEDEDGDDDDNDSYDLSNKRIKKESIFSHIIKEAPKINLSSHPYANRSWYPEDFIKNPEFERQIGDRAVSINSLTKHISNYYKRQQDYMRSIAIKDFTKISELKNYHDDKNEKDKDVDENGVKLITPIQNADIHFRNNNISPIYKYEINKDNLDKYIRAYPNILRSDKVKNWEIDDSLEYNDVCEDFLLTQEVKDKNEKARERSRLKAVYMLFHSCFIVENGKQVGNYIFKREEFNKLVCNSNFVIDEMIFK
ncbi:hypothetical protein DAPK24_031530 [Pichia kluyveri]|uniref:Uncharacterized protein n=1 Tax=Pichia kluyveri TaxID=36015 RepID=A0AAV5R4V5_PICKL|nr:hypothetical protein DAPK24_031530 [Pichia kluyveri]